VSLLHRASRPDERWAIDATHVAKAFVEVVRRYGLALGYLTL
jgi:hypothetical protein